jgi:hypothetical protein
MKNKLEWWEKIKVKTNIIKTNMEMLDEILKDTPDEEVLKNLKWKK